MATGEPGGWAKRWVMAALGGAALLGVAGARLVPPPPPLVKVDPNAVARAKAPEPPAPPVEPARAEEEPGTAPALIWLLPMAGQLSGAPNAGQ
jgi:hypothetical protein